MTATGPNRSPNRPRTPEQPPSDPTPAGTPPDAPQGCTCDHHGDALDTIRGARTLGGHAGIAQGLTAIAHAILAGQETP